MQPHTSNLPKFSLKHGMHIHQVSVYIPTKFISNSILPADTPPLRAGFLWGDVRVYFHNVIDVHHRKFSETRNIEEIVYSFSFGISNPTCSISHPRLDMGWEPTAYVALLGLAIHAFSTVGKEYWNHKVSFFDFFYIFSHALHNTVILKVQVIFISYNLFLTI